MTEITASTPQGTPVGTAKGIVHLFWLDNDTAAYGLCNKVLRGRLVDRTGAEPTCQECIDEADWRAAHEAGFEHSVHVRRFQTGRGAIAGSGMRYGCEVRCWGHLDEKGHATIVWTTNSSGRLRDAEEIARQHYLAAYRDHLTPKEV